MPDGLRLPDADGEILARNVVRAVTALTGMSRGIAANMAAYVAEGTDQDPDDLNVTRTLELGFVGGGAKALRATVLGKAKSEHALPGAPLALNNTALRADAVGAGRAGWD